MTDREQAGKYGSLSALRQPVIAPPSLDALYRDELEFVWRTVRYLGVAHAEAEDVVHEVFIIVQRRLGDFDPQYSVRSWLAGISRRVVMHHHRSRARAERKKLAPVVPEDAGPALDEWVEQREAAALLQSFLDHLDDDKREVFVLCELEGLGAPEVAHATDCNLNTVYSRLRAARHAFEKAVARWEATRRREGG